MSTARTLEFFFDYGSPYSYLAATQVEAVAARASAEVMWKPFLLGAVLKATGSGQSEAASHMYKARYFYKDLQDWTRFYGLPPLVLPPQFPVESLKANRLGLVAQQKGKLSAYTRTVYDAAFVRGIDISQPQVLTELVAQVGLDPQEAFARMLSQEIKDRLRKNTDDAVERGAFGAPTFFVGDEMFFGNDRLFFVEQALQKAA